MKDITTHAAATEAALSPVERALDKYTIKAGVETGLIKRDDVDFALLDMLVALYSSDPDMDIDSIALMEETRFGEMYRRCTESLQGRVWDKTEPEKDRPGEYKAITGSPAKSLYKMQTLRRMVQTRVMERYTPRTPRLIHEPDAIRFLELLIGLFPNVVDPRETATAVRLILENIHNSCGTPGASFTQACLWMVSPVTGGVGKSEFLKAFGRACDSLGIDAATVNFETRHITPSCGLHTVVIDPDIPKFDPESEIGATINKIIDRDPFPYDIKYGAAGLVRSYATVIVASNYYPYDANERRFAEVKYLSPNLRFLPQEDKEHYIPYWNRQGEMADAIVELFRVVPFVGDVPYFEYDDDASGIKPLKKMSNQYAETLDYVHRMLDIAPDLETLTPPGLAARMVNSGILPLDEKKLQKTLLAKMVAYAKSRNAIKEAKSRVDPARCLVDWRQFRDFSADAEGDDTGLGATRAKWNSLVDALRKEAL